MHLLQISQRYYPYQGGSELLFQEIAERMVTAGHQVTVWTTDARDLDHFWAPGRKTVAVRAETHNGVAIRRFAVKRLPGPPIIYPLLRRLMLELSRVPGTTPLLLRLAQLTPQLPELEQALAELKGTVDIIHSTNITLDFMLIPVWRWARANRVPHVMTPHVHVGVPGDASLVRYYTMRHQLEIIKSLDRVIAQSPTEGEYLVKRGVPRSIIHHIGAGIDPVTMAGGDAARFRAETGITAPIVLYVGTLARDKGIDDVIAAMRKLWDAGRPEVLVALGSPMAQFEAMWETLPADVRARIHILPRADDRVKRDALAAAAVFTMPSRTDAFGIVYLEAWYYGLPVVGACAGGVPDVIADGENGFLVPYNDPAALATRLRELLDDPELARRLGAAGRETALRYWTWERKCRQVREVYQSMLAEQTKE